MHVAAGILFEIGQQRGEVTAGLGQRIVKRGIVHQLADSPFARPDLRQQAVHLAHGIRKPAGEPGVGQFPGHPVQAADDAVYARSVPAQHRGELRKVVDGGFQIVLFGVEDSCHVARDGVQVAQRPGDILRVGLHQAIEVGQRSREVGRHLRHLLLEEIQLRPGHVHQVAFAHRAQRVAFLEIGVRRAVGDLDGLSAHQPVAVNLGLGVGRNVVLAFDGELQHDVVAALRIERNARHRTDFDAFHHDRRRRLHAVDLVVGGVIDRIAAENVESFQKPDSGPRGNDHRHAENSDFNFPSHI